MKNKIFKNYHFLLPLMIVVSFLFGIYLSPWYLLLLTIPVLYLLHIKINLIWLMIFLIGVIAIVGLSFAYHQFVLIEHIVSWIEKITHCSVRKHIGNFIESHYDQATSSFIKLILLNIKEQQGKTTYYHMIDLSIVYLIVVSGFHISVLKRIISHCCAKHRRLANGINLGIIIFYCYLLNFAVSVTRVLFMFILTLIFDKKIKNRIDILALSGLVSILLGPSCIFNIGFCMSYLCTLVIIIIFKWEISNVLLEKLLVNIGATFVSLPFVIYMQKQISIWVIINSFIFSYVFALIFVYFILTFWIIWIGVIQHMIVTFINFLIQNSWNINVTIPMNNWTPIVHSGYFIVFYLLITMIQSYQNKQGAI